MELIRDKLNIKEWAEADRPREKLMGNGPRTLSEAELLAIILGSGTKQLTAVELAKQVLKSVDNDVNALGRLGIKDLVKFSGIGEAKAIGITAALELGRRRKETESLKKDKITSSKDAADIFQAHLSDIQHEEFWILLLNRANKVIGKYPISKGGVAGTVVDLKILFKIAIENLASSVILCHNHPSGNEKASDADIKLTRRAKESGALLDISVLDHIIIAGNNYFSFADAGIM